MVVEMCGEYLAPPEDGGVDDDDTDARKGVRNVEAPPSS